MIFLPANAQIATTIIWIISMVVCAWLLFRKTKKLIRKIIIGITMVYNAGYLISAIASGIYIVTPYVKDLITNW